MPTDLLANYASIPYADFSFHALGRGLGLEPFSALLPLLLVTALYGIWLKWSRGQPIGRLLLGVAAWLFFADLFLPAYRNNYNDVLILNVVALGLVSSVRFSWGLVLCFLALPIGRGDRVVGSRARLAHRSAEFFSSRWARLRCFFLFNSGRRPRKV